MVDIGGTISRKQKWSRRLSIEKTFVCAYPSKEKNNVMNCVSRSPRKNLFLQRDLIIEHFKDMKFCYFF